MRLLLAAAIALTLPAAASAAVVDTIDATSGQANTFFVPRVGQERDDPYYRDENEDWGWMHNPIASGFTSASLNISAFDVDEAPCGQSACEEDLIEAYDMDTNTWIGLGTLSGDDDAFSFTDFDVYGAAGGALIDDIEAGLEVRMDIDVLGGNWLVSLSKSVLTTDGADPGNPNPVIPLPASGWAMLAGLGMLGAMRHRRSKTASA